MKRKHFPLSLCSARVFLNIFDLVLENQEEINEFTKLNILDKNNSQVGMLYFENGIVKIQSATSLGDLNANYDIAKSSGFTDLEWNHDIIFQVSGNLNFSGDMQIGARMDTTCRIHAKIKYIDKDNNEVELKFMDDGYLFSYDAKKDDFREVLRIDPWDDFDSFICHTIRNGEYDSTHHRFPNESIKYVWNNGDKDRNHLKTLLHIVENFQTKEYDSKLYKRVGKETSDESIVQKGLLMQKIDPDFSKKIVQLTNLFKKDDVSFFTNLIDITFNTVNEESKTALFGTEIAKISYYNGADNLLDAYFGKKECQKVNAKVEKNKEINKRKKNY